MRIPFRTVPLLLVAFVWLLPFAAPAAWAEEIVVVVAEKTPVFELSRAEVEDLFLGKRQYWNGVRVALVSYGDHFPVMQQFLAGALGMTVNEYRSWWIKRIFRYGDVPPIRADDAAGMARTLTRVPGAVGFMFAHELEGIEHLRAVYRLGS